MIDGEIKKYHLKNGVYVYASNNHTFGTDAVILSDFAMPKHSDRTVDMGTGCGIIPLIWRARGYNGECCGIDISEEAIELCGYALKNEELTNISFLNLDLKCIKGRLEFGYYDVVTMNPPYKSSGDGVISNNPRKSAANHELLCDLDDICYAASKLLRFGGRFCMCNRPSRLSDMIVSMRKNNVEVKRIRFVQQRINTDPSLVLVEGKYGAKPGVVVEKTLFIENEKGENSEEMQNILNCSYQKETIE